MAVEKDPFRFDDEDEDGDTKPTAKTAEELQKDLARMGKALRDSEKARKDAETLAAEAVSANQKVSLRTAGLTDRQASVFLKEFETVTEENIAAFRTEVLGEAPKAEEKGAADAATVATAEAAAAAAALKGDKGFQPVTLGGGGDSVAAGGKISPRELADLLAVDPAAADKAAREGRVDMSAEAERVSDRPIGIEFDFSQTP